LTTLGTLWTVDTKLGIETNFASTTQSLLKRTTDRTFEFGGILRVPDQHTGLATAASVLFVRVASGSTLAFSIDSKTIHVVGTLRTRNTGFPFFLAIGLWYTSPHRINFQ
jgi:hypothetical protein